jgi:hypothetical protein
MAPRGPNDEEGVVDPDDLDITKNEEVHEIRDGKYVIATENSLERDLDLDLDAGEFGEPSAADPNSDPRAALLDHLESLSTANGFVVAGRFDGEVHVHESASDDLGSVFGDLLEWYATRVDDGTPSPEVLGILCLAANVRIRYPLRTVADLLAAHDLSPDDPISDLVDAARTDGLVIPPSDRDD